MEALKQVISELGGCPLLKGEAWDGAEWTLEKTIKTMRKMLGFRSDKLFDVETFFINLEIAYNVSPPHPLWPSSFHDDRGNNKLI